MNNDDKWKLLNLLFIKNKNNDNINNKTNIPKKIHQIWLGGKIPSKYEELQKTWINNNPDWEYKLWTDEDLEKFDLVNKKVIDNMTNLGSKSDLFRYEILYKYGGVYIDTDFECIKSFNDFIHLDLFSGVGTIWEEFDVNKTPQGPNIFNGLIGIKPKHKILKGMIENLDVNFKITNENIFKYTGPKYFTDCFFKEIHENDNVVVFPREYFYPFPAVDRYKIRDKNNKYLYRESVRNNTYAVHLWYTSWQK